MKPGPCPCSVCRETAGASDRKIAAVTCAVTLKVGYRLDGQDRLAEIKMGLCPPHKAARDRVQSWGAYLYPRDEHEAREMEAWH